MPRYEHDPTQVTASIAILPKDDYEFIIGKPKSFERTAKAGHQSYGIMFPLIVANGPQKGKKTIARMYLHSEGAAQMTKRFQMAVQGLATNDKNEKEFDLWAAGRDWSYDTDSGAVGEEWANYEGKHLVCDLDVEMITNDKGEEIESQVWGTWAPIEGAAEEAAA